MNAWDFGILPSGSDQSSAINAAIAACNGRLNFLGGTYVAHGLTGKSNLELTCEGYKTVIHSDSNDALLTFTNQTCFGIAPGINLDGYASAYPSISDAGQKGLVLDQCSEFKVAANITRISGSGIEYKTNPYWYTDADFSGLRIANCYRGFRALTGGEFARISDFTINRCVYGIDSDVGNQIISNGWMILNSVAIRFTGGTNNGHSQISNVIADHNSQALVVLDVDAGISISNFQVICDQTTNPGDIQVYNSRGIIWNGGQFYGTIEVHKESLSGAANRHGQCLLTNVLMRTDIGSVPAPSFFGGAVDADWSRKSNITPTGAWANNN